jgi:hypothetical protein
LDTLESEGRGCGSGVGDGEGEKEDVISRATNFVERCLSVAESRMKTSDYEHCLECLEMAEEFSNPHHAGMLGSFCTGKARVLTLLGLAEFFRKRKRPFAAFEFSKQAETAFQLMRMEEEHQRRPSSSGTAANGEEEEEENSTHMEFCVKENMGSALIGLGREKEAHKLLEEVEAMLCDVETHRMDRGCVPWMGRRDADRSVLALIHFRKAQCLDATFLNFDLNEKKDKIPAFIRRKGSHFEEAVHEIVSSYSHCERDLGTMHVTSCRLRNLLHKMKQTGPLSDPLRRNLDAIIATVDTEGKDSRKRPASARLEGTKRVNVGQSRKRHSISS